MTRTNIVLTALVCAAGCAVQPPFPHRPEDELGGSAKALLDPGGPDIGIDQRRLQVSARVVSNATVRQAEVDEGCAGATTGRTLVRFDVRTPNHGPADLEFGRVTCQSTDPSPACAGVDCSSNPACCCNGRSECTASGGPYGDAFEFACPHGHIHFRSFAEYRLLSEDGSEVVARGHKQSFCLMDIEGIEEGTGCVTSAPFSCGNQGITAGCADVYSAALPCSYVDATGVPEGRYLLEVRMDPLDVINESNESNNVAIATVTIGDPPPPPPAPTDVQRYLVRDGTGTQDEGREYYASLSPSGFAPGTTTLDSWRARFIDGRPTVSAIYRNVNELGFWREMTCTRTVGRDAGGCFVVNWDDPDGPRNGDANLGTVAMRLDEAGRTQFFVFSPAGLLQPSAVLDDEGPKFVPRVCTTCHGGEYAGAGADPDLGSVFREFEPSLLQRHPEVSEAQAEQEWFDLNQAIRSANRAVRREAEGAPFGVDAAVASVEAYVAQMYVSTSPPISIAVDDPAHVPPSWRDAPTEAERASRAELWTEVVNPYCQSCHRQSSFDYNSYATFRTLAANTDGRALLRRYIEVDPDDPDRTRLSFMPQSALSHERLSTDAEALLAIERWLDEQTNRAPVANAGADATVTAGTLVALSGAGSTDPDGDPLLFRWTQVGGTTVTLSPSTTSRDVTFVAPSVTSTTTLELELRASDTRLGSTTDRVLVTVLPRDDSRLVASASDLPRSIPDDSPAGIVSAVEVAENRTIAELRARVRITHPWIGDLHLTLSGPGGFTTVLHNRSGRDADDIDQTFLVTSAVGRSTAGRWELRVSDNAAADVGTLEEFTLELTTSPTPTNRPPVARAGSDRSVHAAEIVSLTAMGSSDPDGDPLTFLWEQVSGPPIALAPTATSRDVTFRAPLLETDADIGVRLRVRDGRSEAQAIVTIHVEAVEGSRLVVSGTGLPLSIPDDDAAGVTSSATVSQDEAVASLAVTVDVEHTYIGDLTIVLRGPGAFSATLFDREGGSADDVRRTFEVPSAVGRRTGGTWSLVVSDHAGVDVGVLHAWSLDFAIDHTVSVTASPPRSPGDIVVSEIMRDPSFTSDAAGEWIEVHNPTSSPLDLSMCVLADRGTDVHTIDRSVIVPPGSFVTLARTSTPGFTPSYVYGAFALGNSSDEVRLTCGGVVIDEVAFGTGWPATPGASMSLSPAAMSASSNDGAASWCAASVPFATGDRGTPGAPNPACP